MSDSHAGDGPPAAPIARSGSLKVLVVDDHADSADALAMLLEVFGHDVRSCGDGQAAVDMARQWAPDLILMDLTLPILSGYDAARRIVADTAPSEPPALLVALSGHSGQSRRDQSQEAGFARHLVKPVGVDLLQEVVEQARAYRKQ